MPGGNLIFSFILFVITQLDWVIQYSDCSGIVTFRLEQSLHYVVGRVV
jgi:hypothetical protein